MATGGFYDIRARYSYLACGGYVFHASTLPAGVAPGTALSTTPPFTLWNPLNSNILASILAVRVGYVSGTMGAGSIVMAQCQQVTAPTGGTVLTPINGLLGSSGGAIKAYQGATLLATPTIVAPLSSISAFLATTATNPFMSQKDELAGEISIPPGTALCIQGVAAAGTSPLVMFGVSYIEEAYVLSVS